MRNTLWNPFSFVAFFFWSLTVSILRYKFTVAESFLDKYFGEGTMEKERKRKLSNNSVINQRASHGLVNLSFNFT